MRAILAVIIVTWSLIVICIHQTTATNNDAGACPKSLTEEGVLEWSQELGGFHFLPGHLNRELQNGVTEDPSSGTSDNLNYRVVPNSEGGSVCISAPQNYRVLLQISLKTVEDGLNSCLGCENSCLAFQNFLPAKSERFILSPTNDQNKTAATTSVPTTTGVLNLPNDAKNNNNVSTNITTPIRRYARYSHLVKQGFNAEMVEKMPEIKSRRKCKRCRRKGLSRKDRRRRRQLKFIHLLIKYSRLVFNGDPDKIRRTGSVRIPDSLQRESRLKPTGSSALQKIFDKLKRLVDADKRDLLSRHRPNSNNERNKRQTQNHTLSHYNILDTWNFSALPFILCGLDHRQNSSSPVTDHPTISTDNVQKFRVSAYHPGVATIDSVEKSDGNFSWVSLENEFNITSHGQWLKMDALHRDQWNDALLRHIRIKVSFVSTDDSYHNESLSSSPSDGKEVDDITAASSTPKPGESSATIHNVSHHVTFLPIGNDTVSTVSETGSHVIAIAAIASACTLAIFLSFVACFCRRRLRKRRRRMREDPAKSAQEDHLLHEKNPSAIYRSQVSTCTVTEPEVVASKKNQGRQKKEGSTSSAGNVTSFRDDEIRMHKHNCGKKKKLSHAEACKEEQYSRRPLVVQKCGHQDCGMGLSQHRHFIVCQIAEKPHSPMMGSQYIREYLPPASQINNAGSTIQGSPHSHTNFDKFNRMQNNPYRRHSPNLSFGRLTLPATINLPDGEELYRHNTSSLPSSVVKRPHSEEKAAKNRLDVSGLNSKKTSIKSPPNRTVFDSEVLPFLTDSQCRKSERPNGYPGPPSGMCHGEQCKMGRTRRGQREQLNYMHCLSRNEIDYNEGTNVSRDQCICKYILKHIKEPPPDYSDVVRDDMLTPNDKQYDVTCFGDDVKSCEDSSASRRL